MRAVQLAAGADERARRFAPGPLAAQLQESLYGPHFRRDTMMTEGGSAIAVALHDERRISPSGIRALYDHYGWWPERSEGDLASVLEVGPAVGAWTGEQLVGFARAVGDGRFRAYIEDVVVHPEFRRAGIATAVLSRLLPELDHVDVVSLFCSSEHEPVYARSGFVPRNDVVMHRYRTGDR